MTIREWIITHGNEFIVKGSYFPSWSLGPATQRMVLDLFWADYTLELTLGVGKWEARDNALWFVSEFISEPVIEAVV